MVTGVYAEIDCTKAIEFTARIDEAGVRRSLAFTSRTRPPVDEEGEEVGHADVAVAAEVWWTAGVGDPDDEKQDNIRPAEDVLALHGK